MVVSSSFDALKTLDSISTDDEERVGVAIVRKALEEPIRQIVFNAGLEPSVVTHKVASSSGAFGFNALTNQYEDLIKAGVIDPTKVARTALENAASIAGLMLTTEAVVFVTSLRRRMAVGGAGMPSDMNDMY